MPTDKIKWTDNQTGRNTQHTITAKSLDFYTNPAYLVITANGDNLGNYFSGLVLRSVLRRVAPAPNKPNSNIALSQ